MGESFLPKIYFLSLMTLSYIVGELTHFLINTTSRAVAREIGYGEMSCFKNETIADVADETGVVCSEIKNETDCALADNCHWSFNGLGIQYQVSEEFQIYTRKPKSLKVASNAEKSWIVVLKSEISEISRDLRYHDI